LRVIHKQTEELSNLSHQIILMNIYPVAIRALNDLEGQVKDDANLAEYHKDQLVSDIQGRASSVLYHAKKN
jgi:hypothetical protein